MSKSFILKVSPLSADENEIKLVKAGDKYFDTSLYVEVNGIRLNEKNDGFMIGIPDLIVSGFGNAIEDLLAGKDKAGIDIPNDPSCLYIQRIDKEKIKIWAVDGLKDLAMNDRKINEFLEEMPIKTFVKKTIEMEENYYHELENKLGKWKNKKPFDLWIKNAKSNLEKQKVMFMKYLTQHHII